MIEYAFEAEDSRAVARRGDELLGEATVTIRDGLWTLDHTYVDEKARGQRVGSGLVRAVAEAARAQGARVLPLCSYARMEFDRREEYRDIRAEG